MIQKDQIDATNKKNMAYEIIKQRIINNEYKPLDTLTEQLICSELGISKTPVREAFKELEKDEFVKATRIGDVAKIQDGDST